MKKIILLGFVIFINSSLDLYAKSGLDESILAEYLKIQKEFSAEVCKPGTEAMFQQLDKNYRGNGNFIPTSLDEKIDLKTVKNLIPLIKEKNIWIQSQIDFINSIEDLKKLKFEIDRLENDVSLLLEAKKDYFFAKDKVQKANIEVRAQKQFQQLLKEIVQFKNQIPFLLSFNFPVNHLSLRAEYERFKKQNNNEGKLRANSIYLYRKIVQDGTYDQDLTKGDAVVRAAFDTLYLSLNREPNRSFLTDNERVDFHYVLSNFDKILSLKKDHLIARFQEWKERNERTLVFYQDLVEGRKIKLSEDSQLKDITVLLEERARALYTIKEFVLSREAEVYGFWSKRSELMQSLFAIETILYSEVGRLDTPDALERRDVAQIVINRSENPAYNMLTSKDSITKYLPSSVKIKENLWQNVLFKEGEFSFTYFYIPGNFHIYCPDMSHTGQFLRRENVRIALEYLNKPRKNFTALRYYSRLGMFGRIEMDSLWDDFKVLPEVPGKPVRNPRKVYSLLKRDRYKFLYNFTSEDKEKNYMVVDLGGKPYVVDAKNNKQIYYYRNPHQFKYFTPLK